MLWNHRFNDRRIKSADPRPEANLNNCGSAYGAGILKYYFRAPKGNSRLHVHEA